MPAPLQHSCKLSTDNLNFRIAARQSKIRVIGSRENQLITDHLILDATIHSDQAVADPSRDLLKMAVIERHGGSGNVGLGFIQGIGLKNGAIAGTVAHDHHNLVVIGCDDISMHAAMYAVHAMGGGLVVADGEIILATLPLPVAGLMSDRPIEEVRIAYDAAARRQQDPGLTPARPLHGDEFHGAGGHSIVEADG